MIKRELECLLTPQETKDYSAELARLTQKQAELEDRKKEAAADYKAKIDACVTLTRVIARKVSTGKEMREIDCEWNMDFESGTKDLIRSDTWEVVETVKLTDKEKQMELPIKRRQPEPDNDPEYEPEYDLEN